MIQYQNIIFIFIFVIVSIFFFVFILIANFNGICFFFFFRIFDTLCMCSWNITIKLETIWKKNISLFLDFGLFLIYFNRIVTYIAKNQNIVSEAICFFVAYKSNMFSLIGYVFFILNNLIFSFNGCYDGNVYFHRFILVLVVLFVRLHKLIMTKILYVFNIDHMKYVFAIFYYFVNTIIM